MKTKFLTTAFFLFCLSANAETQLKVIELSDNETAYELAKVRHIDFTNNDNLSIIGKDGKTLNTVAYNKTKAIVFNTTQSGTDATNGVTNIKVYPNPTQEALHISGIESDCAISIFNQLGQTVFSSTATNVETIIEVGNFKKGTYILKVGNKVVKFIKD